MNEVGTGIRADRNEQAAEVHGGLRAIHGVDDADTGHELVAVDVRDLLVPEELDLRVIEGTLLHRLGGAQRVLAVDDVDLVREAREEGRLFHRRVAAANDGNLLLTEERAVTGGAPGDAVAAQAILIGDAELAIRRPGRVDHGEGLVHVAVAQRDLLDLAGQVERHHVVVDDLGAETGGLVLHLRHQVRAHDSLGKPGVVLDLGGLHQLAAELDRAGDDEGGEVRARGIDGRGVSGGAGADDDELAHVERLLGWVSSRYNPS